MGIYSRLAMAAPVSGPRSGEPSGPLGEPAVPVSGILSLPRRVAFDPRANRIGMLYCSRMEPWRKPTDSRQGKGRCSRWIRQQSTADATQGQGNHTQRSGQEVGLWLGPRLKHHGRAARLSIEETDVAPGSRQRSLGPFERAGQLRVVGQEQQDVNDGERFHAQDFCRFPILGLNIDERQSQEASQPQASVVQVQPRRRHAADHRREGFSDTADGADRRKGSRRQDISGNTLQ